MLAFQKEHRAQMGWCLCYFWTFDGDFSIKQLMTKSLFLLNISLEMFDRVVSTPLVLVSFTFWSYFFDRENQAIVETCKYEKFFWKW